LSLSKSTRRTPARFLRLRRCLRISVDQCCLRTLRREGFGLFAAGFVCVAVAVVAAAAGAGAGAVAVHCVQAGVAAGLAVTVAEVFESLIIL
jgi:hypothetical protein